MWARAVAIALLALVAGCGGPAQPGGRLTVLWSGDVDSIDPGIAYYSYAYMVTSATQRALLGYRPDDAVHPVPDLAEALPRVSADGRTVTVRIRTGVRFSPPVDREVTARDVRYAIERGFFATVGNGYAPAYFGDVVGARPGAEPGTQIRGIETPDDRTLVFRLRRATGAVLAAALVMPLTAPVPEEYARRFDGHSPSTYGEHQVATGPYMVERYQPGRGIHLVRNPRWDRSTDYRPAHLDEIDLPQGYDDVATASRRILTGRGMVNGDLHPPAHVLERALHERPEQVTTIPAGGGRWLSMNTQLAPFDDIDIRRAVIAGLDREAMRRVGGGEAIGELATHFLPPGMPGFEQAGGLEGPGFDFYARPRGDLELAARYLRRARHAPGDREIVVVGTAGDQEPVAAVVAAGLERLGFRVKLRTVSAEVALTRFCGVPEARVHICPNLGWIKDFNDPQTILGIPFSGATIQPQGGPNWSLLDVPRIDTAIEEAKALRDPAARARAWADVDRMVTGQAATMSWIWDEVPLIASRDVAAVPNRALATWDLSFTSLR